MLNDFDVAYDDKYYFNYMNDKLKKMSPLRGLAFIVYRFITKISALRASQNNTTTLLSN